MDERERLGRIAYEADDPHGIDRVAWGRLPPSLRAVWIEAAAAVAEAVREQDRAALDAKLARLLALLRAVEAVFVYEESTPIPMRGDQFSRVQVDIERDVRAALDACRQAGDLADTPS